MDAKYDLGSLITRVKDRLKDVDFSDVRLQQFINDTYFEILSDTKYPFLDRVEEFNTNRGGEFPLPRDYQSIYKLVADRESETFVLNSLPPNEYFEHMQDSGFLSYKYTIYGSNKLIYSLPKLELLLPEDFDKRKDYRMRLFYLARPKKLDNKDKPVIPEEFSEILVLGAMTRAEQYRDNFDFAQIYENKMNELVLNMISRYCNRTQGMNSKAKLPVNFNLGA